MKWTSMVTASIAASVVVTVAAVGSASAASSGIATHLLRAGEQTGFHVSSKVSRIPTISAYVTWSGDKGAAAKADRKLLKETGFVDAAAEHLAGSGGKQGFSIVGSFSRSDGPAEARNALFASAVSSQRETGTTLTRFRIPGVPTARGVTAISSDGVATANVYWTEGRCTLGSGLYLPDAGSMTPTQVDAPVVHGIRTQLRRSDGHCS